MLSEQSFQARPFSLSFLYVDADQNHPISRLFQTISELPKILVLRQQDASFRKGHLQDLIVGDARLSFRHINDVVTGSPKTGHDPRIATLVGKEFHGFTRYPKAICSSAR